LLTADAFGVLPPVSILGGEDVMYHFVQGFTSKLAGTEVGVTRPQAAFSSCFGAPFMSHKPSVYAKLLRDKMEQHEARCVLLNTGWSGGPAGQSPRISIKDTRSLLNAALRGNLHADGMEYDIHPVFKLRIPRSCPGVDAGILNPRAVWANRDAYDASAQKLRDMFRENFAKQNFAGFGIDPAM
jgi:phosphoenolpyruvate carboxykinase (ATP)